MSSAINKRPLYISGCENLLTFLLKHYSTILNLSIEISVQDICAE